MTSSPASEPVPGSGVPGRCVRCGARLAPAQTWCTLCHTEVSARQPETAQVPAAGAEADGDGSAATKGLTPERIDRLLARLAAQESSAGQGPKLGPITWPGGRAQVVLLAAVAGLVLLAGGMLFLYVLGVLV